MEISWWWSNLEAELAFQWRNYKLRNANIKEDQKALVYLNLVMCFTVLRLDWSVASLNRKQIAAC